MIKRIRREMAVFLAVGMVLGLTAGCGRKDKAYIIEQSRETVKEELVFISSTAKGNEVREGGIMHSMQMAIDEFEHTHPDIRISYKSYTPMNSQEKSYDDVVRDRVRNNMGDDLYIMNPDVAYEMYREGYLADLSDLTSVQYLTKEALSQCTVDGKVISVPMTMLCYGLFVNEDLLNQCGLELPRTKQEFLHCCEVLKENGIMPLAANRWWMETFVLTQGLASLYIEDGRGEKIAALNSGETTISQYMRPGFEFLQEMMDRGYFDVDFARNAEAGDEREQFLNQEVAFVVHYDTAIQDQIYGTHEFRMAFIGFPTDEYGQVNLFNAAQRICISSKTANLEMAKEFADQMTSKEVTADLLKNSGGFPPRKDIDFERPEILATAYENVKAGRAMPGSNPEIDLEQWGTTCVMVQELYKGRSVDEIMAEFDAQQMELVHSGQ